MFDNAVPLHKVQHRDLRFTPQKGNFTFASTQQLVPIVASEAVKAAETYAIVFPLKGLLPLVLLGVRPGQNAYVGADGQWATDYVPAFVRRYPFALAERPADAKTAEGQRGFTFCIVPEAVHFSTGKGIPLFNEDGSATALVTETQQDLAKVHADAERTQFMVKQLEEAGLLVASGVPVVYAPSKAVGVQGLRILNVARFRGLTEQERAALAPSGALALAEMHLHSLKNLAGGVLGNAARPVKSTFLDADALKRAQETTSAHNPVTLSDTGLFAAAGLGGTKK